MVGINASASSHSTTRASGPSGPALVFTPAESPPAPPPRAQNFLVVLLGAEYDPEGAGRTEIGRLQDPLNVAFTSLFAAELLLSLYARWLAEFLRRGR